MSRPSLQDFRELLDVGQPLLLFAMPTMAVRLGRQTIIGSCRSKLRLSFICETSQQTTCDNGDGSDNAVSSLFPIGGIGDPPRTPSPPPTTAIPHDTGARSCKSPPATSS